MSVASEQLWEHELAAPRTRVSARLLLGGLVVTAWVAHTLLAFLRIVPTAFPDEYLYAALGRSIAAGGAPSVRGSAAHFPALLEPLLAAPAWLLPRVALSLHAIQAINAAAVALAAVPAYLLVRRLRLGERPALGVAVLAVVVPQLSLASQVLSDPIAYPLALGAIAAAVALVERPSRRTSAAFLVLSVLAAATRVQLAVLPACALAAVVVDGLRTGALRAALSRQRALLAAVALGGLAAVAVLVTGRAGYYAELLPSSSALASSWRIAPVDLYVVLLSSGAALAPAALVGGALALARPRSRAESAFGVVAATFLAALLAQACLYGDTQLLQERYLFYAVPLLGVAFALRVSRPVRRWTPEAVVAGVVATFAGAVPLAGYVAAQTSPAQLEGAVRRLELVIGDAGSTSLVVALAAALLAAVGVAAAIPRRGAAAAVLAVSTLAAAAVFAGGVSYERLTNVWVRTHELPANLTWVDDTGVRSPAFLVTPWTDRSAVLETLFWNRSVERVLLVPGARPPDKFAAPRLAFGPDGTLLLHGRPLAHPLVVDQSIATVGLRDAREIARGGAQSVWLPTGPPRLDLLMVGRTPDGALASGGSLLVWTHGRPAAGWIELRVRPAQTGAAAELLLSGRGSHATFSVPAGATRTIRIPFCGGTRWSGGFRALDVVASRPRYVAAARACR